MKAGLDLASPGAIGGRLSIRRARNLHGAWRGFMYRWALRKVFDDDGVGDRN